MASRGWRWYSTPLSADRGEVSVLAVAETILAMSISIGIAWYYETLTHIMTSACLTPLLLLRTHRSLLLAHALHSKILDKFFGIDTLNRRKYRKIIREKGIFKSISLWTRNHLFAVIMMILLLTGYTLARIFTTLGQILTRPLFTFSQIPFNWKRVTLCTDTMHLPELLPGAERLYRRGRMNETVFSISELKEALEKGEQMSPGDWFGYIFLFAPTLVLSISYRWSLKSTALIWSPLLWVIINARTIGPVRFRLDDICNDALYRIMRGYSVIVVAGFLWKIVILLGPQTVVLNTVIAPLIEPYIAPADLPLWQVATAINAALAWLLYFLAQAHLRAARLDNPNRISDTAIKREIAMVTVVRNVLALYTIACALYITGRIAKDVKLPAIELILFPWS